jgi:glycosyltransferase involved in cell wall biosynthesis
MTALSPLNKPLSNGPAARQRRPVIAFFAYHDVFEDFYSSYGISQAAFASHWSDSGNHALLSLAQSAAGDVVWYMQSIAPEQEESVHRLGFRVRYVRDGWLHRQLWCAFYLPRIAWRWRGLYMRFALIASYLSLLSPRIIRILLKERPDFLFSQDYATGRFDVLAILSGFLRSPLIAYHAGSRYERYLGRVIKPWSLRRAKRLLVSSQREAMQLAEHFDVPESRMTVVLTPIDTSLYRPRDREESCRIVCLSPERRYILFVGRLDDPVKQVSMVIRAFHGIANEYPDADLVIIGDGPDRAVLEALALRRFPDRFYFVGWVPGGETLARYYCSAECLVLPSLKEGFPTVVGEALASGTPVIGTDVGAISELVNNGETGWLLPPGNETALTDALVDCLDRPEQTAAMGKRARNLAEARIAPEVVAATLREVFSKS